VTLKTFDDILVQDASLHTDEFGVTAIYQPGVLDRSISVIVTYKEDDGQVQPVQRRRGPIIEIEVQNNATTGIAASEFGTNQKITIPPRQGADARNFQLARIVKQDAGMVTFEAH